MVTSRRRDLSNGVTVDPLVRRAAADAMHSRCFLRGSVHGGSARINDVSMRGMQDARMKKGADRSAPFF
jgi:hypothetical protein